MQRSRALKSSNKCKGLTHAKVSHMKRSNICRILPMQRSNTCKGQMLAKVSCIHRSNALKGLRQAKIPHMQRSKICKGQTRVYVPHMQRSAHTCKANVEQQGHVDRALTCNQEDPGISYLKGISPRRTITYRVCLPWTKNFICIASVLGISWAWLKRHNGALSWNKNWNSMTGSHSNLSSNLARRVIVKKEWKKCYVRVINVLDFYFSGFWRVSLYNMTLCLLCWTIEILQSLKVGRKNMLNVNNFLIGKEKHLNGWWGK